MDYVTRFGIFLLWLVGAAVFAVGGTFWTELVPFPQRKEDLVPFFYQSLLPASIVLAGAMVCAVSFALEMLGKIQDNTKRMLELLGKGQSG